MQLIPAIDLRGGRCVRLYQGSFDAETSYDCEPLELLHRYCALGAAWLHVVDLDGAREGRVINRPIVGALAAQRDINLQCGGGVRSIEVIEDLLNHGVQRVVVGSSAIEHASAVAGWVTRFGPERICLAFDVRMDRHGEPRPSIRGWTRSTAVTLWQALEPYAGVGLRHVLCTDIERDGALSGPNLPLYERAQARFPQIQWQASGGVRSTTDLTALAGTGVAAAISGKALLENRIPLTELCPFLPNASFPASTFATGR